MFSRITTVSSPWHSLERYLDVYEIVRSGFYQQLIMMELLKGTSLKDLPPIMNEKGVRLLVLIFGRPSLMLVREQIMPEIDYWHHTSCINIDFVSVGFYKEADKFNVHEFATVKNEFEKQSSWKYSHQTDLVLLNAFINGSDVELDFGHVVSLTLEQAIEDKAISSIPKFFGEIVNFASRFDGSDPTWGFSDFQGKKIVGSALKRLLISLLPESLREETRKAFYFHVKDYSKKV